MQQYREANVNLTTTPSVLVGYDPTRKVLILSNAVSAAQVFAATLPATLNASMTAGLLITNTLPVILTVKEHGIAVVQGWYGRANGASGAAYIGEVFDLDDPWPTPPGVASVPEQPGGGHDPTSVEGVDRPDRVVDLTSELLRASYAR